jgi:hypothetical protein
MKERVNRQWTGREPVMFVLVIKPGRKVRELVNKIALINYSPFVVLNPLVDTCFERVDLRMRDLKIEAPNNDFSHRQEMSG